MLKAGKTGPLVAGPRQQQEIRTALVPDDRQSAVNPWWNLMGSSGWWTECNRGPGSLGTEKETDFVLWLRDVLLFIRR